MSEMFVYMNWWDKLRDFISQACSKMCNFGELIKLIRIEISIVCVSCVHVHIILLYFVTPKNENKRERFSSNYTKITMR